MSFANVNDLSVQFKWTAHTVLQKLVALNAKIRGSYQAY